MKLVKNLFRDTFINRRVRFTSQCEIMPLDITGKVIGVSSSGNEMIFQVRADSNGKIIKIGSNQKNLAYQILG